MTTRGADPVVPAAGGPEPGRAALEARQAELLRALVAAGPVPEGFDPEAVGVQARALLAKRRRVAAAAWPELAWALGGGFEPLFARYAAAVPRRSTPGRRRTPDAVRFGRWLWRRGRLPLRLWTGLVRRNGAGRR